MSIQRRNRARGKQHQKRVAEQLEGAIDIGILGGEDIYHPRFSVEAKSRKKFVGESWFKQAGENNTRNVTPIVVVHITGKHVDNDYVMIKMKDFKILLSDIVPMK